MKNGGSVSKNRRLEYARGYLDLGMTRQAAEELAKLEMADASSLDALSVWIDLRMETKAWGFLVDLSREYAQERPREDKGWICWAYALRELQRVEEARDVLLRAEALHGESCAILHYNLACYYCLLGDKKEAKRRLRRAFKMNKELQDGAKDDPDLQGLGKE